MRSPDQTSVTLCIRCTLRRLGAAYPFGGKGALGLPRGAALSGEAATRPDAARRVGEGRGAPSLVDSAAASLDETRLVDLGVAGHNAQQRQHSISLVGPAR